MQILEQAAGVEGSKDDVLEQFDRAKQHNFNVVRMFGFGTKPGFGLQVSPVRCSPPPHVLTVARMFESANNILWFASVAEVISPLPRLFRGVGIQKVCV